MKHSVEAYLERLSTDSLYGLIRYCTSVEEGSFYEEEAKMACDILLNREQQPHKRVPLKNAPPSDISAVRFYT